MASHKKRILDFLWEHPGSFTWQIDLSLARSGNMVGVYLRRMMKEGLVDREETTMRTPWGSSVITYRWFIKDDKRTD